MTPNATIYRRVLRRETHSPRTVPAAAVAVVLLLCAIAAVVFGVWALIDRDLFAVAATAFARTAAVMNSGAAIALAILLAALAALLIVLALAPGRRSARGRDAGEIALLVDDGVLADATADSVAAHCGVPRGQVRVTAGRRKVTVRVTPVSGVTLEASTAAEAAAAVWADAGFPVRVRVQLSEKGAVA